MVHQIGSQYRAIDHLQRRQHTMSPPRLRAKPERALQPVLATPTDLKRRLPMGLANKAPNAAADPRPERQDRGPELEKQLG
jgi:hypothetical protein